MALFTEEITPIQVPNVLGSTQPRAFLADSVIDPTTLPVDQSLGLSPTASIQQPFMFEPMKSAQQPSIVGGMFSPELRSAAEMEYLQNRQRAMQNEALAYAQLTPMQQAQYGFYRGGQQLGDVVGGALGGQDPQLRMIAKRQALTSQLDLSNPESLIKGAQLASQSGDTQFAMSLVDRAKALQESIAKQTQEKASAEKSLAETAKILSESQNKESTIQGLMSRFSLSKGDATTIAGNAQLLEKYLTPATSQAFDILKTGKFTPESVAAFANTGNLSQLESFDMSAKPSEPWLQVARELNLPAKKSFNDYTPEQVQTVNKKLFDNEIALKKAGAMAVQIPLGDVLDKVYLSKDREEAAKNWAVAGDAYKLTVPMIDKLDKVEKTVSNAFTGAGADAKLAFAKGLSAVGVKISDRATDSEIANAISAQVVQQIAKVFPGSQSNKELEQLVKSKFNLQQELPTILRLIRQARDEMYAQKLTYEQGAKLNDKDRTSFNANLAQGQNYQKIQEYRNLESKYNQAAQGKVTITPEERQKAIQLKTELGL